MLLGDFRRKTEALSDDVEMVMVINEKVSGDIIAREEIIEGVKALDFDEDVEGQDVLTLTDGEPGAYSL